MDVSRVNPSLVVESKGEIRIVTRSHTPPARTSGRALVLLVLGLLVLGLGPTGLLAQGGLADPQAIASQNLRGYNHMFIAYFIAWAIILGWVVSIARRLGRVEEALKD